MRISAKASLLFALGALFTGLILGTLAGEAHAVHSDCCIDHGTPGCDQPRCEEFVCFADAFCCATSWDNICADEA